MFLTNPTRYLDIHPALVSFQPFHLIVWRFGTRPKEWTPYWRLFCEWFHSIVLFHLFEIVFHCLWFMPCLFPLSCPILGTSPKPKSHDTFDKTFTSGGYRNARIFTPIGFTSLPFPTFPFVPIIVQVTHIDPKKYMCTYMMMHESHRMKLNGGGTWQYLIS